MRELKLVVGVMLLLLALGTSSASAMAPPVYDSAFGAEELGYPTGLALDGEGDIWVADEGNALLQGFETSGKFLNDLEFFGYPPTDVAVDSEGHIWATFGECCLVELDGGSGKFLKYTFSATAALGVAVDHEGSVWVTLGSGIVQQYNSEAKLVSEFGEEGSEPGQFYYPLGIDVDAEGNLWVADTGNARVQKLNPEGEVLDEFGEEGSEPGQLVEPADVEVDAEGNLWVADAGNDRVQAFDAEGEFLTEFGEAGSGEGQMSYPWGIGVDGEGNIYVADYGNGRIQRWEPAFKRPTVKTLFVDGPGETKATLRGLVNPNKSETAYQFEYGTTAAYGDAIPIPAEGIGAGSEEQLVQEAIEGLEPNTTYHYRVSATNEAGTSQGEDKTFTTPLSASATTEAASDITEKGATLHASVDANGWSTSYWFEYGTTTSYGAKVPTSSKSAGSGTSPVPVSTAVTGLEEGVTYHYRVAAKNAAGTVYGGDQTLTVLDPPQTTITTPTLSYTAHEVSEIDFESDQPGSTFRCGFDEGDEPAKACKSPYALPQYLEGWHTFVVVAENEEELEDPTAARWIFNPSIYPDAPSTSKLVSPDEGARSASHFTLRSKWDWSWSEEVSSVSYQLKAPSWNAFKTIPPKYLTGPGGVQPAGWIFEVDYKDTISPPLSFDIGAFAEAEDWAPVTEGLQLRAVFNGIPAAAGASKPVTIAYSRFAGGPGDAVEQIGPASVDLLTGAFTISRTDVSIPVPGTEANLEFTRTYSSAWGASEKTNSKTLGQMWQPSAPVESEYEEEAWQKLLVQHRDAVPPVYNAECEGEVAEYEKELKEFEEWEGPLDPDTCLEEAEIPEQNWVEVLDNGGAGIPFERTGAGPDYTYVPPEDAKEYALTKSGSVFILADVNGTRTTFSQNGSTNEYVPSAISFAGTSKTSTLFYDISEKKKRLKRIVGPAPAGVICNPSEYEESGKNYAPKTTGCRTLELSYTSFDIEGGPSEERLDYITYYNSSGKPETSQIVARYSYDPATGNLIAEWDPRIPGELEESYAYESTEGARLTSLTPAGVEPWEFAYYPAGSGGAYEAQLKSVSRASLLEEGPETATTTIAYDVPITGEDAPYDLGGSAIAQWGQKDYPVNATAVFPPTEVPGEEPSDYDEATIHYLDPDGREVNTASPSPPGVEGDSIATSETDENGNVVRELTPQNRLEALLDENPAERAQLLDTDLVYTSDGTMLWKSWGPQHLARVGGWFRQARTHTTISYDKGAPAPKDGEAAPRLPTKEVVGAALPGYDEWWVFDSRTTETTYDWSLRKPTATIVDPEGLNLVSKTTYNSAGQVTEERQPSDPEGNAAGTTRTVYWTAGTNSEESACGNKAAWAGLPCVTHPVAEPSPAEGNPKLPWTWFTKYSSLDQLEETKEKTNGALKRTTTISYDAAGRPLTTQVTGEGTAIPPIETTYDEDTGAPLAQRFVCEEEAEECEAAARYSSSFGSPGAGNGQFNRPAGSAFDAQGDLWVVDNDNNRLQKFDLEGKYLAQLGSSGSANGQLSDPMDVAIDANGDLWVADRGNSRVQKFNAKGEYLSKFGSQGSGNGQFSGYGPRSIAIDAQGDLWVSDYSGRIQEFNAKGEFVKAVGSFGESAGLDVANGKVWVGDWTKHRVSVFSDAGEFLFQFGSSGAGKGQFSHPDSVEVDAKGNVWVLDEGNGRVQQFDQEGEYVDQFGAQGAGQGQFSFSWPTGMTSDANGDLWVSDVNHYRVQKWIVSAGFDDPRETRTAYDKLGRPIEYEDADGNVSGLAYDLLGRPVIASDGKGAQTITYDEASGVATELIDSAAGAFQASYDADRKMTAQLLPNGLAQQVEYDETGAAVGLSYEKQTYCSSSCTWLEFDRQYSAVGQVRRETGTFGTREYSYDEAGRLTLAKDTEGGQCTTRAYAFDANTNRTSLTTRAPKEGGACDTESEGDAQGYEYDSADRLIGAGIEYDQLGRTTALPAEYAGGGKLSTGYYVNDLTRSQSQGGVTNTYELDAALRQRQRTRTGGSEEGAEIYHYAGGSDSPSWIDEGGSKWTRSIGALGGSLGALQTSSGEITFQIADMHGDVIATADDDPEASELLSTQRFDEYGNPQQSGFLEGGDAEYGWLGAKRRRTQLPSGVIQMGVRSYVPSLGRFLTPDPIRGGSANAYEYAGGDPINNFDLTGECYVTRRPSPGKCKKKDMKKYKGERRKARSVSRRSVTIVLIERRGGGARASGIGDALKDALDYVHDKVGGGVKKIGNGFASLTLSGPEYKAARRAFALSMAWSPDRLIQAWQCGEYVAGVGRSFGDCDPWEMYNGAPPDSAR